MKPFININLLSVAKQNKKLQIRKKLLLIILMKCYRATYAPIITKNKFFFNIFTLQLLKQLEGIEIIIITILFSCVLSYNTNSILHLNIASILSYLIILWHVQK